MFTMSLNRVHDRVRIVEGDERLELRVDGDPNRIVAGLNEAQKRLKALNDESTEEEQKAAALYFVGVMFGEEQAKVLMEFYHDDPGCVIKIGGQYFSARLAKLIEKAQKRAR